MNQPRALRRASAFITAALALAVAVAMVPRVRLIHGVSRFQIGTQTSLSHSKRPEHNRFAAYAVQIAPLVEFTHLRLRGNYISPRIISLRVPQPVRGPPLAI